MEIVDTRDLLPVSIVEPKLKQPPPLPVPQAPPPEPAAPPPENEPVEAEPPPPPPPEERPEQAIPLPEQQIVSPSAAGEEIPPPPDTRLLSDRDNVVEEQMVRRGEPAQQEGEEATEPEPPEPPAPAADESGDDGGNQQLAALPKLDDLLPSALQLAGEGYGAVPGDPGAKKKEEKKDDQPPRRFENVWLPTSKEIGTLDFLPDVREGDITLLNTKAELFAPFVRRVAVRVFQNLLILLRRELPHLTGTAEETVTMEAVMTRDGDLASLTIKERSSDLAVGSGRMLQQACRQGFFDRNPPAGAESDDGQIHFLLRTHVLAMGDGRGVRYGYRVAFQAGLR